MKRYDIKFEEKEDGNFDRFQDFDALMSKAESASSKKRIVRKGFMATLLILLPVVFTLAYRNRAQIILFLNPPAEKAKEIVVPVVTEEKPIQHIVNDIELDTVDIPLPTFETRPSPRMEEPTEVELVQPEKVVIVYAKPQAGYDSIVDHMNKSIDYNLREFGNNKVTETIITFWVNQDGHISRISIRDELPEKLRLRVIKAIETMPKWSPATVDGTPFRSKVGFRLKFQILSVDEVPSSALQP